MNQMDAVHEVNPLNARPRANAERAVYQPPMLVEVGGFAEETQGFFGPRPETLLTRFL